jgi:Ca-activated chloride channel family protein
METPSAPSFDAITELVSVVHRLDKHKLLRGVASKCNVVFCLQTGSLTEQKPVALEVCLCLDVSGSMKGEKLDNSKLALCRVLDSLKKDDIVCAVSYDHHVETMFGRTCLTGDQAQLTELKNKVNALSTGGSTNMSGGLNEATKVLLDGTSCSSSIVRRIFLFSDGVANAGVKTTQGLGDLAASIYRRGVTISTFG